MIDRNHPAVTAPTLRVIPGGLSRPLPSRWDGDRVKWGAWETDGTTLSWHLPEDRRACDGCGDVEGRLTHCRGDLLDAGGNPRRGRRLYAFRCLSCGHDDVLDWGYESWCLGPEDYGPNGSTLDPADHYHWKDES